MSLDDLPDEQAVGPNHASVTETAFEIRVALRDQGRRHLGRPLRGQAKPLEFVGIWTVAIADADDRRQPRIVAEATGRATAPVAFFRASNRSRALRIAGQFD